MREKILSSTIYVFMFLLIGFFSASVGFAQPDYENSNSGNNKANFFLTGGYAHTQSRGGMAELKAELQFSLSQNVRIGVGAGYMSDSDNAHMNGNIGGFMGGMMSGVSGGISGHTHSFSVVPITATFYYALPLGSKIDAYMLGGAGYYMGTFTDISTEKNNGLGGHLGIGFDFKITNKVIIIAEGAYRFVSLDGFTSQLHPGFIEGMEREEHEEGSWHFHHGDEEYHFHESHENLEEIIQDAQAYSINLTGFSVRAGIKFSF